jgi:hypothetical protein
MQYASGAHVSHLDGASPPKDTFCCAVAYSYAARELMKSNCLGAYIFDIFVTAYLCVVSQTPAVF